MFFEITPITRHPLTALSYRLPVLLLALWLSFLYPGTAGEGAVSRIRAQAAPSLIDDGFRIV
jgi:hypothetical protein